MILRAIVYSLNLFLVRLFYLSRRFPESPSQTVRKTLQISRRFFNWGKAKQPQAFKKISRDWINSLRLERGAEMQRQREYFTLEECLKIAALNLPGSDLAARRDQAAACLLFLSGMRIGAFVSLPIACVNLQDLSIRQFPSAGVKTKNSKHATTYLFNIPVLLEVVKRWDAFVRERLPESAMWYAHIEKKWSDQQLMAALPSASRAGDFNKRLRILLDKAGVPRRSAHKFRHGHAVYGLQNAKSLADYKAISQNLMHENIQITDGIYADLVGNEVKSRVTGLGTMDEVASLALTGVDQLRDPELVYALNVLAQRLAR